MSSEFFATRATGLSCNPNSSGKQSTLVKKEIEFLHANLCEERFDSDYGCRFLDGTEERKEDLRLSNSQHWILHVLCAPQQRSRKGRGDHPKMVFSIFFTFSFEHFRFAIFGKTKTIAQNRGRIQSRQAMPGFSCLYYKTTWPFAAFCLFKAEIF